MSRGDRVPVSQNLSLSMRKNYEEYGVDEYYKKVGATYRNPHYPGIRTCLFAWFNKWWAEATCDPKSRVLLFDMACGSGEVTAAFKDWWTLGRAQWAQAANAEPSDLEPRPFIPRRKLNVKPIGSDFPPPRITAADPYTAEAYQERTSYPCATISFKDICEGALPMVCTDIGSGEDLPLDIDTDEEDTKSEPIVEMVICSFALHLIQNASELFALLWELSTKARWLIILAPHKKPDIKEGWGWVKWDISSWNETSMIGQTGELLNDRVHCRAYRSTHFY